MVRVTAKDGALVIITNGTPEKRMNDYMKFAEEMNQPVEITHKKVELSKFSQLINIMRSKLGNKSLKQGVKDPAVLKYTMEEMVRIQNRKKEEELMADKRTTMLGMILKAKRLKEEKEAEEKMLAE